MPGTSAEPRIRGMGGNGEGVVFSSVVRAIKSGVKDGESAHEGGAVGIASEGNPLLFCLFEVGLHLSFGGCVSLGTHEVNIYLWLVIIFSRLPKLHKFSLFGRNLTVLTCGLSLQQLGNSRLNSDFLQLWVETSSEGYGVDGRF